MRSNTRGSTTDTRAPAHLHTNKRADIQKYKFIHRRQPINIHVAARATHTYIYYNPRSAPSEGARVEAVQLTVQRHTEGRALDGCACAAYLHFLLLLIKDIFPSGQRDTRTHTHTYIDNARANDNHKYMTAPCTCVHTPLWPPTPLMLPLSPLLSPEITL